MPIAGARAITAIRVAACALALLTTSTLAQDAAPAQGGPIRIASVIPYAATVATAPAQCDWNAALSRRIVADAKGRVVASPARLDSFAGTVLAIEITQMHVGAGGRLSNKPSWILIHGELRIDGRRVDSFDFRRNYVKAWGACGSAHQIGTLLAADVVGWLLVRKTAPAAPAQ